VSVAITDYAQDQIGKQAGHTNEVCIEPGMLQHLASRCRGTIDKLTDSTECEIYNFSAERDRLCDRLIDIETGRDVTVYRFEIPAEMQPPREDGRHVYTLRSDRLVPAEYQRVVSYVQDISPHSGSLGPRFPRSKHSGMS